MNRYSKDPFMGYLGDNSEYKYSNNNNELDMIEEMIFFELMRSGDEVIRECKAISGRKLKRYSCMRCEKRYKNANGLKYHKRRNHLREKSV
jgi:hypothetical protein